MTQFAWPEPMLVKLTDQVRSLHEITQNGTTRGEVTISFNHYHRYSLDEQATEV